MRTALRKPADLYGEPLDGGPFMSTTAKKLHVGDRVVVAFHDGWRPGRVHSLTKRPYLKRSGYSVTEVTIAGDFGYIDVDPPRVPDSIRLVVPQGF